MTNILQVFVLIPLIGFLSSLFIPRNKEKVLAWITISTAALQLIAVVILVGYWFLAAQPSLDERHAVLYAHEQFEVRLELYFDRITATYSLVGAVILFLVAIFSRYYLHREEGFKRFFTTVLLFFTGYNLTVFSGNFETLFVGWEILGLCSFLLISFYRDRYLPVKNSLKVISIYRLGDICLMLAMWVGHHLWHQNISFAQMPHLEALSVSLLILVSAAVKSALIPFLSWIPRAMEGPTTSSAIFYGSLSIHLGAFLLLRISPLWENIPVFKACVIGLGLLTCFISAGIARVQSSVKSQIAYSSVSQIGLIFVEIGFGFHLLALFHFAANAFLRTYQLLVSPSVLSYLIHHQFYHFNPAESRKQWPAFFRKLEHSFYILCLKEWNFDSSLKRMFWNPFKTVGKKINVLGSVAGALILLPVYLFLSDRPHKIPSVLLALFSLILVLKVFAARGSAKVAWSVVFLSHLVLVLGISLNEPFEIHQIIVYLMGTTLPFIVGYVCLKSVKNIDQDIDLDKYHGYITERPLTALVFLLSCLALFGFPITLNFIGVDMIFTHIHKDQPFLLTLTTLNFVFIEVAVLRIYVRVFLGQNKKNHHVVSYRAS